MLLVLDFLVGLMQVGLFVFECLAGRRELPEESVFGALLESRDHFFLHACFLLFVADQCCFHSTEDDGVAGDDVAELVDAGLEGRRL